MNSDMNPCFKSKVNLDVNLYFWYITIKDNEITLYSNGYYLGTNIEFKKIKRKKYMKIFKYEKIKNNEYLIYYYDKKNVLTINNNDAILDEEKSDRKNQIFKLIEEIEYN